MAIYSPIEGSLGYDSLDHDAEEVDRAAALLFLSGFSYSVRSIEGQPLPELHVYSRGVSPENLVGAEAIKGYLISENRLYVS